MRVIKYTLDDPGRVGHSKEHTLLTNLLDEKLYPPPLTKTFAEAVVKPN